MKKERATDIMYKGFSCFSDGALLEGSRYAEANANRIEKDQTYEC